MPTPDILCLGHVYETREMMPGDEEPPEQLVEVALNLRSDPRDAFAVAIAHLMRLYEQTVKCPEPNTNEPEP
jgi:hypothetical protein